MAVINNIWNAKYVMLLQIAQSFRAVLKGLRTPRISRGRRQRAESSPPRAAVLTQSETADGAKLVVRKRSYVLRIYYLVKDTWKPFYNWIKEVCEKTSQLIYNV